MPELLDALDLTDGKRVAIVADHDGLAALPMVCDQDGQWRRARSGDGVAEALLRLLARQRGLTTKGHFTVQSWAHRTALGEKAIGVDQTNESVIVGDAAVVKWATQLQEGPHPAPHRIAVLREAGFAGMPSRGVSSRGGPPTARKLWWRAWTSTCPVPWTAGRGRWS